jgi:NitT/TauT family transport system substrate-binding protein
MRSPAFAIATTLLAALTANMAYAETTVRFANLGIGTANLYQYLGLEKGIYQKHGVNLEMKTFLSGGPSVMPAAASGQIDMGDIGTPILIAIASGIPIKVVGAPALKRQQFVLIARPEIKTFHDLIGKTVGIGSIGGGQDQALRVILASEHTSRSQVNSISVGNEGNGYFAFKSGKLAAIFLTEPVASKLELEGSGHLLLRAVDFYGRYEHSYVFATNQFISAHGDAIRSFFEANREAIDYAAKHEGELIAFGASKLSLDKVLLKKIFDESIPTWDASQSVDVEGTLNAISILKSVGDIDAPYKPDISKILDQRFVPAPDR